MTEITDMKKSLRQAALDAYRNDYEELTETWNRLESKAQGNIAICGIFIAGAFAFIREISVGTPKYEKAFLVFAILCLVVSVVFSVLALKIRGVASAPLGENVNRLVKDLLRIEDAAELSERLPRFISDQMVEWRMVIQMVERVNKLKAKNLWRAQLALLTSIAIVAFIMVVRILR